MKEKLFLSITAIALVVIMLVALFAIGTFALADSTVSGRTFTGDNAATSPDSRFELVKPLGEVPLTFEATINLSSNSIGCVLFGQYDGDKTGLYLNIEIYNGEITICYANNSALSSYNYICFNQFEDSKYSLKNLLNRDITIAITATPTAGENKSHEYTFRYYVNGELAHPPVVRQNVYFTKDNLVEAQKINPFAIGSNNCSAKAYGCFTGRMKSFSLYNAPLSSDEIKASYDTIVNDGANRHAGLILNYDMSTVENPYYETDLSGNGYHACRADKAYIVRSEGRTFSGERMLLAKKLTEKPLTIEAVIKTTSKKTTIFGNFVDNKTGCFNFEIFSNSSTDPSVALCFPKDESGTLGSVIFKPSDALSGVDYFVPNSSTYKNDGKGFTQVVITATPTEVANTYNFDCYINGVKAYKTKTNVVAYLNADLIQASGNLALGANGSSNFSGNIRRVNLYNRALTANEIARSYKVDTTFGGLIAGYDMTDSTHIRNPQFEADISGNGYHAQRATNTSTGMWFDSTAGGDRFGSEPEIQAAAKPYFLWNELEYTPRTFEATVYSNSNNSGYVNSSTIFGNFPNGTGSCINFELFGDSAALVFRTHNGTAYESNDSIVFTTKLPGNQWLHLVVVNELLNGKSVYKLYVNGEYAESITAKPFYHDNIESAQDIRKMSLGGSGKKSFDGGIIDVAIYSEPLTAAQIRDSFLSGVDKYNDSLMAHYDMKTVAGKDFIQDLSGNNHHASRNDYTAIEGGRWFNYDEERLAVVKNYEEAPLTINAEIYVPTTLKQAYTIFGNYYARDYINLDIYTNGKPRLLIHELPRNKIEANASGFMHSVIFDVDVRGEKWTDLTVIYDRNKTGTDKYVLYVDGVKVESYTLSSDSVDISYNFELNMDWIQRAIPFTLGRNASKCFQGKIKNLALFSAPLKSEDVVAMYENGADLTRGDVIAYYNLDNPENTKTFVKDETGNGYDFEYKFFKTECDTSNDTYDYSFAFIGDTQFAIYKDINEGTSRYSKPIYDWLIKNKNSKKLEYVFGLGDVSDADMLAEYEYASYLFKTLGDAGIRYAVTPGNHDGHTAYKNYANVFSKDTYLTDGINSYSAGSVTNYYETFEVGEYKYMVIVLEFGAPDAVLEWANSVVAQNRDRQVIVLTHGYIGYDGGFLSESELHSPGRNAALNSGEEIWEKFVSRHENIIISACGHIDPYNIKQRHDVGVNGNIVHQFLIDNQALDKTWSYDTGMVAMFYFSNGGKDVRVEYVSATKSLRAQASDPNAKDIVFGEANQFSFTLDIPTAEKVVTAYGEIPYINTNLDLNAVVLFKNEADGAYTFVGGYASVDQAFAEVIKDTTGSYTVLLRDDARMSAKVSFNNFSGNLTLDLGGYELKVDQSGNYLFDIYRNNATSINATYTVMNGSITKAHGRGLNCINYGTDIAADSNISFTYDNVTFKSLTSSLVNNVIFCNWENGYSSAITNKMYVDAVFNDCTFDLKNSINGALMFSMTNTGNGGDVVVYDVVINGGVIAVKDGADLEGLYTADARDTITFGKTEGGNYTSLVAPSGATEPTAVYNGLEFVKISEADGEIVYRLRPTEVADVVYAPKMSITLATEFVMNVYVPVNYTQKFTFNGVTYDSANAFGGKVTTLDDGCDYYVISVALGSSEAASEIKLVASVNASGTDATATFTFSIPKYAAKVIAGGNDVEKTLAKDVLAYIKAAYEYFTEHNDKAEIERVAALVDSIIGDYKAVPVSSGATNTVAPVVSVTLNLSAKPTIRFYVTNTAVEFYANGKKLNTVTGVDATYGAYVELDVYAYALCEAITYAGGSYHISSFVNGAKGTAHETLVNAFVKYVESAADYRNSVVNK